MNRIQYILFIFFFTITNSFCYCQEYAWRFQNFSISDGLPSSQIYEIIQTKDGYLWFGTDRGVTKYNGLEFETYTIDDGLASNVIFYMTEDPLGNIWSYGMNRKLSYFDGKEWKEYYLNNVLQDSLFSDDIPYSIGVDYAGLRLYFERRGTNIIGYEIKKSGEQGYLKCKNGISIANENFGGKNHSGFGKFYRGHKPDSTDLKISFDRINIADSLRCYIPLTENNILRSCKLSEDTTYISCMNSLFIHDGEKLKKINSFNPRILDLEISKDGNLLIGTGNGIWVFDVVNETVIRKELISKEVSSIYEDDAGGVWVGTLYSGLYYFDPMSAQNGVKNANHPVVLLNGNDKSICYFNQNKTLILETFDTTFTYFIEMSKHTAKHLISLSDDKFLFVCGYEQNYILDSNGEIKKINLKNEELSVYEDIYLSEKLRLAHYKGEIVNIDKDFKPIRMIFKSNRLNIQKIMSVDSNQLMLGTKQGLYFLDIANDSLFKDDRYSHSFFNSSIKDIIQLDDEGYIFASESKGLFLEFKENQFMIDEKRGLISDNVYKIILQDENLYAVSTLGISRISKSLEISNISKDNGLSSSAINDAHVRGDTAWIATQNGLDRYVFQKRSDDLRPIKVKSIKLDNQLIEDFKGDLIVQSDIQEISIELEVMSFAHLGDFEYKYYLKGHDASWHKSTFNEVHYSKLNPGLFDFYFSYKNLSGKWVKPKMLFSIERLKPFWLRWWSILMMLIFTAGVIFYLIQLRIRTLQKKARNRYNLLELERQALQSQMNPHFVFNSLSSIQSLIIQKKTDEAIEYLVKFSHLTRIALNHSKKKFVPLNSEIELLENYIVLEQLRFQNSFEYKILNSVEKDLKIPPTIIQPFVENAIKHGLLPKKEKYKTIMIKMEPYSADLIKCTIQDNGVGREEAKRNADYNSQSMGVKLIEERLRLLTDTNNQLISFIDLVKDGYAMGTRVEILIPIVP